MNDVAKSASDNWVGIVARSIALKQIAFGERKFGNRSGQQHPSKFSTQ